jgi:polysaccharide pyruvyl transferase WcaK-like protein
MKVLLDTGVTGCKNIGDQALLEYTRNLFPNDEVRWIKANKLNVIPDIMRCDLYYFVSGGLLKNQQPVLAIRKILAVAFAKIARKKICVGTQTIFLNGFLRALFVIAFKGLLVNCRDKLSLNDSLDLGLNAVFKKDPLIKKRTVNAKDYIAVDSRYKIYGKKISQKVNSLIKRFMENGEKIILVPTMHTNERPERIAKFFSEAKFAICASYHAVVFSFNGGCPRILFTNEYWRPYMERKLQGLCYR